MRRLNLIITLLLLSKIAFTQELVNNQITPEHQNVKGTKISLIPPNGFTKASNFLGFQQTNSGSSLMVLNIPGPFSETSKGLTKEGLLSQGVVVNSIEKRILNGLPALLITGEQNAYGNIYTKIVLAFGTEKETILINGVFPKNLEELSSGIRTSLLSTFYEAEKVINPLENVDFEINTSGTELKFANSIANGLIFTKDGNSPTSSSDKTSLLIAKSFSKVQLEDKKLFSLNRIKQLPLEIEKIESNEPIKVDGISGYEIIAFAKDKKGVKEKVYQVILFSDSMYYIFFGSSESDFDENIGMFKKVIRTFKRK